MSYVQKVSKIRERGQFTVPQEILWALKWPQEDLIVKVETIDSGFRVERLPISHPQNPIKKLNQSQWQNIFNSMEKISNSGNEKVDLTNVLREDRDSHS
jgi:bifunctional DNA-binding transcriptional regulator/antitoxin component of YhaV-PrlF toxin-antitoxin module